MSDLELRVRVEAEVAAARREISGLKGEVAAFGQAAKAASGVSFQDMANRFAGVKASFSSARDSAFALLGGLDQVATGYDMLRASIDPAYAATQRFTEAQTMARLAVANGIATEQQAAATLDLLAQKLGLVEAKAGVATGALRQHTRTSGAAGASSANLAANFNDVAMMAALGQNPLMIAIQQGTQIGQVFGQAGAGGAVGMLKAGFMAFLSPTTLVTIALIAGGAALLQWLTGAGDAASKTKTLEEAVGNLDKAITDFKTKSSVSLEDLKKKFGEVTPEVIRLNDEMTNLAGAQAIIAATEALRSLKAETEGSWFAAFTDKALTDLGQVGDMLQVRITVAGDDGISLQDNPVIKKFQDAVAEASSARGFDAQIAALRIVQDVIIAAAGGIDNMSLKQGALLAKVQATEAAIRQQKAAQDEAADAGANSVAAAQALLDKLLQEVALRQAIRTYGEDSAQVAMMRLEAERKVHQAMVASLAVSQGLKDELNQAWEAAHGISQADIASAIQVASDIASSLATNLWDAFTGASALSKVSPLQAYNSRAESMEKGGFGRGQPPSSSEPVFHRADGTVFDPNPPPGTSSAGGGVSAGSLAALSAQARKAIADLDLAIAAINEKVKAGLMTTAEAADGVASAKEQAANALADLIVQLDKLGPSGSAAADLLRANMRGLAVDLKAIGSDLADTLAEGFKSPFKDFLTGASTAREAMGDFGEFVMDKLAEMAAAAAVNDFFKPLMNMLSSGLADAFGLMGGGDFKFFAAGGVPGGVPGGAPLSAYRNQVLDQPTLFPMARGMGLMAEAGPEAIMPVGGGVLAMMGGREIRLPLTRGAGGRLGVELPEWDAGIMDRAPVRFAQGAVFGSSPSSATGTARDGGGRMGNVIVNITTPPGHTAKVQERVEGGDLNLDVIVEQIENRLAGNLRSGRGAHAAAVADTFGLDRRPR